MRNLTITLPGKEGVGIRKRRDRRETGAGDDGDEAEEAKCKRGNEEWSPGGGEKGQRARGASQKERPN